MMMMRRVMCVLAVVLCCACGYTMAAAATTAGQPKAVMASTDPYATPDYVIAKRLEDNIPTTANASEVAAIKAKREDELRKKLENTDPWGTSDSVIATRLSKNESVYANATEIAKAKEKRKEEEIIKKGSYHPGQTDPVNEIYECAKKGLSYGVYGKNCSFMNASDKSVPVDKKPESQVTQNSGNTVTETSDGAADVPPATAVSEGNGSASAATTTTTTTNTHTESPNATNNSSVPVTDRETTQSAPTVQKKGNADSSVSPVWMRTAAPLLIVAVLVSVVVY